ncbi:uncharacterized protein MCYG_06333 [Microsporum canis CBS 113480]|uniref:Uncharacterized protein n=1 Tax=Arthroderma otae (strain ATCC MYA-4605 / CBS 113480) TaxID=554155 RepID=C5FUD0_ARTOC|nr:uncharacterized protein MCYG_06333 [Microsporum canis CBS 113480]EEQ33514.1 predicted protein [Microsporum canis CBS 113480]
MGEVGAKMKKTKTATFDPFHSLLGIIHGGEEGLAAVEVQDRCSREPAGGGIQLHVDRHQQHPQGNRTKDGVVRPKIDHLGHILNYLLAAVDIVLRTTELLVGAAYVHSSCPAPVIYWEYVFETGLEVGLSGPMMLVAKSLLEATLLVQKLSPELETLLRTPISE